MEGSKGISKVEVISKKKNAVGYSGTASCFTEREGVLTSCWHMCFYKKNTYFYFSKLAYVLMYVPVDAARR